MGDVLAGISGRFGKKYQVTGFCLALICEMLCHIVLSFCTVRKAYTGFPEALHSKTRTVCSCSAGSAPDIRHSGEGLRFIYYLLHCLIVKIYDQQILADHWNVEHASVIIAIVIAIT